MQPRSVVACAIVLSTCLSARAVLADSEGPAPEIVLQPFSDSASPPLERPLREVMTFMNGDGAGRGAHARVWQMQRGPARIVLDAGPFRDFSGTDGVAARTTFELVIDRVSLSSVLRSEKMFDPNRDEVDLHGRAGASVRIVRRLEAQAEYIAEDLEAVWEPEEADGGMRRFLAAGVLVRAADHWHVAAGPALEIGTERVQPAGRVALDYRF